MKLEPGDTLILFSDGVTEAMDPAEELYGVPRLREVLTGQSECALDKLQKSILESVENFAKGAHQADDLTLLIVRYRSTPAVALTETDLSSSSSSKIPAAGSSVPVASTTPNAAAAVAGTPFGARPRPPMLPNQHFLGGHFGATHNLASVTRQPSGSKRF